MRRRPATPTEVDAAGLKTLRRAGQPSKHEGIFSRMDKLKPGKAIVLPVPADTSNTNYRTALSQAVRGQRVDRERWGDNVRFNVVLLEDPTQIAIIRKPPKRR